MAKEESTDQERQTIGQRIDKTIDNTRDKVEHVSDDVKQRVSKGREQLSKSREAIEGLGEKNINDVVGSAKEFAKQHPGTTLLGGIGIGFLIGYFVRPRD